jgi:chaperone modulatory protein CbpM
MLTVQQVCAELQLSEERELLAWVERRWVLPARDDQGYVFDDVDLARLRLICDMQRELSIDEDTVPLILSLLDQVYTLRRAMRDLQAAIDAAPSDAREVILERLKKAS